MVSRRQGNRILYAAIFRNDPLIRVPQVLPELSTNRLLTMTWLEGGRLLDYTGRPLEERNQIARAMFRAWWHPFSQFAVIHGDPHLGNYTVEPMRQRRLARLRGGVRHRAKRHREQQEDGPEHGMRQAHGKSIRSRSDQGRGGKRHDL